jgi:non-specific serine/threonine protein kinase/serine/threonine-protein kinase
MATAASQCPPADVIAAFAFGELSAANASPVQVHISQCEDCLQTVGQLAGSRTTRSANGSGHTSDSPLYEAGQQIGAYRLVRKLGEGGMGEVWAVEQQAPVRRTVALKLLKPGMDTRQIVARFAAERQVLALMQHPSIAQMFDAGITPSGSPFFVMEYVDGARITSHCDDARLSVRDRLLLFQQVCEAVQHAHQKGVIHRDLKPSNVLITMQDGKALPKVIDFGLAKLATPAPSEATLTEIGTVLGTPAYASPEQLSLGAIDVDTRSDVYSLGVILYELLIGAIPFEAEHAGPAALLELRRSIRELEPTRPSARLSKQAALAVDAAKTRATDAGGLRRQLRGELDWIVMKALDKDRARRYESAGALARDTQRYLNHEPVIAGPPTNAYRVRKFVRRHRVGTAFALVLLSLVLAFALVSAVQLQRIAAERDRAAAEAAKSSSINAFLQETLGSADPWQTGSDISVRETLRRAADKVGTTFKDQPLVAAAVRSTIGRTYLGLGRLDEAEPLIRAALQTRVALLGRDHADVAESLMDLGSLSYERADYAEAQRIVTEALLLRRRALGEHTALVADTLLMRAAVLKDAGEFAKANVDASEAFAIREKLFGPSSNEAAAALSEMASLAVSGEGDLARAEKLFRRAYDIRMQLFGPDDLRTIDAASDMGFIYLYQANNVRSEEFYRTAMEGLLRHLGPNHPLTIAGQENLANPLARLKRFDEASALMTEVLARRRAVLGKENRLVARTMMNIATLLNSARRLQEADRAYAEAVPAFLKAYGPDHPDSASALYSYGVLRSRQHKYPEAERLLRQALAIRVNKLTAGHLDTADVRLTLGEVLIELGQRAEAESMLVQARDTFLKHYGPDNPDTHAAIAALEQLHRTPAKRQ